MQAELKEFDEKTKAFKNHPRHDWSSHAADSFRYMAMAWKSLQPAEKPKDPVKELLKKRTMADVLGTIGDDSEE
jgi:hypothetical protein